MGSLISLFKSRRSQQERFTALLRPHVELLYRMAWRWTGSQADADDLVQDVLMRLCDRCDELEAVDDLRPWLLRVLQRRHVDLYRARRVRPALLDDLGDAGDEVEVALIELHADPHDAEAQLDLRQALEAALAQLDDDQRDVILLHDAEGYSDQETAAILDLNVGTVKSRLHRARARLKKFLEAGTK